MRNMYDYAYEYEYQYHPERAGEMFAVVFASLWLAIMIGMLVFMLGSYLLHSFGLYTIAKRMGKKDAWMAFVPFARTYYHGNMAGLDPTEKYDDQKSGIVETAFSDHLQRSDRHLCTGTRIWHRNDARRKCGESKCDRGGDERTCVFLYVFRSDHCFDLIRSSSDRFERLGE